MALTANDLIPTIKQMAASDLDELGSSDAARNTKLFDYINKALRELASIAFVVRVSDPLTISGDGYVTFQRNATVIDDLYEPLRILNPSGQDTAKRTSFAAPTGWWRESQNTLIHVKNMAGEHTLHYKAYPAKVTDTNSPVEFPDSGAMALCYWTAAMIKESRPNAQDEAQMLYARARERLKIVVLANEDGRGRSSGGAVPSPNIVDVYFKM